VIFILKNKIAAYKNSIDKEKPVDRENMANDLAIAKENRKGRNNLSMLWR
jgi:hypothetical protein